ncbi:hypothetical protein DICPUDRAFT_156300 [Dictyostelium purpureum]|uniref:Activator of Hsp90 ATPase AHSA1-like N-terminal domain-containing protein n=1 Tax=Dictyostelium purpureum TaxID=5786 RepID=F0ZW85_DICPU|nr:uncharacterized protein DICPUDRAFT_156300 [Dictyostelium purpureum]EGC31792.1 hypothetical protein DICPUDRAFT_156300 [Dictyostelium purpureum]|eukprot:XP_003291687.1 hypothetical protein DICPUDRAFT_156300 [Dictyostelium purpureum]
MAKVGEGDPRWIVENRTDGHNVNGWHWSEKDCLPWAKQMFNKLFEKKVFVENGDYVISISGTPTVGGECTANNRKGKTIFLYELDVKLKWECKFKPKPALDSNGKEEVEPSPMTTFNGEFTVPYIADENGDEAPLVKFSIITPTTSDNKKTIDQISSQIKSVGVPIVQKTCQEFVSLLKKEFVTKKQTETETSTPAKVTSSTTINKEPVAAKKPEPVKKSNTKTLTIKEEFQCSPMDAFDAFVNEGKLRAYTQSDCVFENKEGGKFSLYGGSITGINKTLSPGSKIVQTWRLNTWDSGVESLVTINFSVDGKPLTNVEIVQTGIPIDEFEKTEEGWRRNILERIKLTFGYGSKIY